VAVYVSSARRGLDKLQPVLDAHAASAVTGRCGRCGIEEYEPYRDALRALTELHQLPRRAPGATRPELIGARLVVVGRD
jgi:hypothetical protein